ncbi:MAG: hypothetical protein JST34_03360 [Bacteroidetes bacterium]|nr:hypothetical protein [Bacteroidota bacterium]
MSFCIFKQQRHRADGTQNTATSPSLERKLQGGFISLLRLTFRHRNCKTLFSIFGF